MSLRIAVAQINPIVGAFDQNLAQIQDFYKRACAQKARVLLTPEFSLCGYPLYDLVERSEVFERTQKSLEALMACTVGQECALGVGHIAPNPVEVGKSAQNVFTILENGKVSFRQAKTLLPNYDVFDESRHFEPASGIELWSCDGVKVGVAICEDLWSFHPQWQRRLYGKDPVQSYKEQGVELMVSLACSPYERGKQEIREQLHQRVARSLGVPLVYVNQVGATDEILFDGNSFVLNHHGELLGRLPAFESALGFACFKGKVSESFQDEQNQDLVSQTPEEIELLTRALLTGIREYFYRTGFKKAIIGLSGGIDSAVVAVLAVFALGPKNVLGIGMPSQFSSAHSLEDAELLAQNLKITFEVKPIKFLYSIAMREILGNRGELSPIVKENLQSRLRGMMLMALSNQDGSLVLTTGNKSELAMGYCTLYGDMVGALAPIGDLFKTQVYELARYLNQVYGNCIPERTLTKAPSAELSLDQKDEDTLPSYEFLDQILSEYLEKGISVKEVEARWGSTFLNQRMSVRDVFRRMELSEYKRQQSSCTLKVSPKAFGVGRRIPISKIWDQF